MGTLKTKANNILTEKTNKIIPENIKKGVQIFNVTGTCEAAAKLNVFAQTTEPVKKDGIWLKTNNEVDDIITDDNVTLDPYWNTTKMSTLSAIPYAFRKGSVVSIGTDVYLFGGNSYGTNAYKYNTLTDTYTKLANIPYTFYSGSAINVGTDIYLFGSIDGGGQKKAYKYNTLTDTYTKLTDLPFSYYGGTIALVGTDIYLIGSSSGYTNATYKYKTLEDKYVKLADLPDIFYYGVGVSLGTDIYLFGYNTYNGNPHKVSHKYDTLTDTYTKFTDVPYDNNESSGVIVGTDVYIFGGNHYGSNNEKYMLYKYNILTDTYTRLPDMAQAFYSGATTVVDNDVYLFGGYDAQTVVRIFTFPNKSYTDKSIILENGTTYGTKLVDTEIINGLPYKFKDVHYYTIQGGLNDDLPTYYGNGTNWINIKNPPVEE